MYDVYLLVRRGEIKECSTLLEIASNLEWEIDGSGITRIDGTELPMSYVTKENGGSWTVEEIVQDIIQSGTLTRLVKGIKVYKAKRM